ncbi:MAG: DUF4350 domain-containing protein [Pseudomonadota bacterium]
MSRNSGSMTLAFIILLAVFIIGVIRLFVLRFETGDVHPEYSSLRADPLGTKIIYESMKMTLPLTVDRHYRPFYKVRSGRDRTFFFLGMAARGMRSLHKDSFDAFSRFVASGGRLVMAFFPETHARKKRDPGKSDGKGQKAAPKADRIEKERKRSEEGDTGEDHPPSRKPEDQIRLTDKWGFEFTHIRTDHELKTAVLSPESPISLLPGSIPCHTTLAFDKRHDAWKVIYTRGDHPVLLERKLGKGSIVLSADTYLFSNEAMLKDRYPALLTWFMGKNRHMLFDEFHFGIRENVGPAGLARKYGLHYFFAGLFLLTGLFIWKKAVHFVPPSGDDSGVGSPPVTVDKDHTDGLVNILSRNIPKKDILRTCFSEWEKSLESDKKRLRGKIEKIEKIVGAESPDASGGDPVLGYQAVCKILSERNG